MTFGYRTSLSGSGTQTIDCKGAAIVWAEVEANGGNATISIKNHSHLFALALVTKQDATGSRTISFDSNFQLETPNPTLTVAPNSRDAWIFIYDAVQAKVMEHSFAPDVK